MREGLNKKRWIKEWEKRGVEERVARRTRVEEKMSDGWTLFLLIHHWVMLHSLCWLRPPGELQGRLCVCLLALGGEGYHLAIDGCQPPSPPHRGDWGKLMAHFQTVSVSLKRSVNLLCDTGEAKQADLLYLKSLFVIVVPEKNNQVSESTIPLFYKCLGSVLSRLALKGRSLVLFNCVFH